MNEDSKEARRYLTPEEVARIDPYGSHKREEEQAQEQPQEQARGQRVATESTKDIEATKLNATVEGLGFFRFQLGSGQLRPAVPPQPTQESQKPRGLLYRVLHAISLLLRVITPLLFLAAVIFFIWQWVQGKHTPPIVSTSYEVFSFAFITSLLTLGGVTLVSLEIRLAELAQQIDANQRIEGEQRAEEEGKQRPEDVIKNPNRPTLQLPTSDETILAELQEIKDKYPGENLLIKWTEKCLEYNEFKDPIKQEIKRLEAEGQRVVKIVPDKLLNGIAVTFETEEYRIPV